MRMIEGGEELRFALESRDAIGVRRKRVEDEFDRDLASEPRVARRAPRAR
jgi:hypothetical protein